MVETDLDRTPNPLAAFNHATLQDAATWSNRLDEIRAPALIIHGTEDIVLPFAHAEALRAGLPGSRLVVLRGSGHELARGDWPVIVQEIERHTS
jgi:pimeloyl-ACP methyl ester carboxylesterase